MFSARSRGPSGKRPMAAAPMAQPDLVEQTWRQVALPHERIGEAANRVEPKLIGMRRGYEHDDGGWLSCLDPPGRFDPAEARHPDVHQHQIDVQLLRRRG